MIANRLAGVLGLNAIECYQNTVSVFFSGFSD